MLGTCLIALVFIVPANRRQMLPVRVVSAIRKDLNATITTNGKIEPISPSIMRAQFATFVDKVIAVQGHSVRRGQTILKLNVDLSSQLAQVRGDLLAAQEDLLHARTGGPPDELAQLHGDLKKEQANVENIERVHRALEQLVHGQAALQEELAENQAHLMQAKSTLETLERKEKNLAQRSALEAERASIRVRAAQDRERKLEEEVRSATVTSPVNGSLYYSVHEGDYVNVGEMLVEIADLHRVQVRAFVDEADLGRLEVNQAVRVSWDAKPSKIWTGRTEQMPMQVVAQGTRSVGETICFIDNQNLELLPNVNVVVKILVQERHGALVVPRAAVRYNNGHYFVFIYAGGKLHRRDIAVGVTDDIDYEVLSGLTSDDQIALPSDFELREGMNVRVAETR